MASRATWGSCSIRRRSEEHTSELQSRSDLVCRLLLEKKNDFASTNIAFEVGIGMGLLPGWPVVLAGVVRGPRMIALRAVVFHVLHKPSRPWAVRDPAQ